MHRKCLSNAFILSSLKIILVLWQVLFSSAFNVWHLNGHLPNFFSLACQSTGQFLIYSIHFTSIKLFSSEMSPYLWWLWLLIYSFNFLAQMLREIYIFYLKMYFIHLDKKNSFPYLPQKAPHFFLFCLWRFFSLESFCQKKYRDSFYLAWEVTKDILNPLMSVFVRIYLDNFLH